MNPSDNSVSPVHTGRRLMLLSAGCFVANVLLIRALGQSAADVWAVAALRFAAGLALCLVLYRRSLDARALFTRPRLILRGVIGAGATYAFYLTIVHLGAGRAIFINNTYVVWSGLLAIPLLAERFHWKLALGAAGALAGLGLLTGAVFGELQAGPFDALALAGAGAAAWVVVSIRQLHRDGVSTPTIFASQCIYGLLLCAPFLVQSAARLTPLTLGGFTAAGVLAGAGQLAMTRAYRDLSVAEGTLIQMLVPLGIAAGGAVFFREHFGPADIAGGLLILGGSLLPALMRSAKA